MNGEVHEEKSEEDYQSLDDVNDSGLCYMILKLQ